MVEHNRVRLSVGFGPLAAVLLVFSPSLSWAELPPAAQAAFDKAMIAAQQQQWDIAISGLQEARRGAPKSPELFYNLGLAESKIPGRELRALAWFGAYLTTLPNAPNAPAVKAFIAALEVKSESNARNLVQAAQDAALLESKHDVSEFHNMIVIAGMWAALGETPRAMAVASQAESEIPDQQLQVLGAVAIGQTYAGDIDGALKTLQLIRNRGGGASEPSEAIVEAQARAGDVAAAQKTAKLIDPASFYLGYANLHISRAQAAAGDIAGALSTAKAAAEKVDEAIHDIAVIQVLHGDVPGALKTVELITAPADRKSVLEAIREFQQNPKSDTLGRFAYWLPSQPVLSEWLNRLDDADPVNGPHALNTAPFLDLAGYVKSLPVRKTGADTATYNLVPAAAEVVYAQVQIERLLGSGFNGVRPGS